MLPWLASDVEKKGRPALKELAAKGTRLRLSVTGEGRKESIDRLLNVKQCVLKMGQGKA